MTATATAIAAQGADTSTTTRRMPTKRPRVVKSRRPSTFLTIVGLGALVYFLAPLLWLAFASTKSNSGLFNSFGFWFAGDFKLFSNLTDVFTRDGGIFTRWLLNTIVYAGVSGIGACLLATAAGYAFAKYRFRGGNALFSVVLGAIMIPTTALAIPTFLLFSQAGLTNTPLAVILPSLVNPFGVYLMKVYAEGAIDDSLMEAARMDGAGEFRVFWQVCMRLLAPGMVTVLLFSLVATWNNYFLPLIMLNSPDTFPLTVGLSQWQSAASKGGGGGAEAAFSQVLTGSLVSVIPLIIVFLVLQRYWQNGLSAGGVKG
jgi:multiple sugar transport system permease protein